MSEPLSPRTGPPEVKIDVPAVVGQFLNDLSLPDLVVELVQNELDAGSTQTTIHFGRDQLTCEGDGLPIDPKGWERLHYILGAGGLVQAKADGIGAKNHGLRAAFLLGDTVTVQSGGRRIDLTVRGDLEDPLRFYPAVWRAERDATGPLLGTRITVPYRGTPLDVPSGEGFTLAAVSTDRVRALYADAVREAPERFIAASTPGRPWRYVLTLSFHGEPAKSLVFTCAPVSEHESWLHRRACHEVSGEGRPAVRLRQHASPFLVMLAEDDSGRVPSMFRRGGRTYGEISWCVDHRGGATSGTGALRYPIGYPIDRQRSGYGFDVSAPFISDRARHTLSGDPRNARLLNDARAAFAKLLRRHLISHQGTRALRVFASERFPDSEAEDQLTNDLLAAGALPVIPYRRARLEGPLGGAVPAKSASGSTFVVAAPRHETAVISDGLARLAPAGAHVVHPSTPAPVVAALLRAAADGDPRVGVFNEEDAAQAVLLTPPWPDPHAVPPEWAERCSLVLGVLADVRRRAKLPDGLVARLRAGGFLPTESGGYAPWTRVRWSRGLVPPIPGLPVPTVLAQRFNKVALLKEGPLRVEAFKIDEHVASADFESEGPGNRQSFFVWLRRSHSGLRPKTLATIATFPVWPDEAGDHHPLSYHCRPSSPSLRALLREVKAPPAASVVSFPGLRRRANGALVLRPKPRTDELRVWYLARMESVQHLSRGAGAADVRRAVRSVEKELELLRQGRYEVEEIARGHEALSRAGRLRDIRQLHMATRAVDECRLLADDLLDSGPDPLYRALGALTRPTPGALLRAMRGDPDGERLYARLELYKSSGNSLGDLADEPLIPVGDRVLAPGQLSFPGNFDYWGRWKTALDRVPDMPDRVQLLVHVGVVHQKLSERLSRAFFTWLSGQSPRVQRAHLPQTLRHWRSATHGPPKWWALYPAVPCLPVRGGPNAFELVSHSRATGSRSRVYLPDFPALQDRVLANVPSCRLVIVDAEGVAGSVMDAIRAGVGRQTGKVKSLRTVAGRPRAVVVTGLETDPVLDRTLANAQSHRVVSELTRRLPHHDVPASALRRDWKGQLSSLRGVRVADELEAQFSVLGTTYAVPVQSGVDTSTGLVCVDRRSEHRLELYTALADFLFDEAPSPLWPYGLLRAMETPLTPAHPDLGPALWDEEGEAEGDQTSTGPGADGLPRKGHGVAPGRLVPVVPSPGALADISGAGQLSGKRVAPRKGGRAKSSTDARRHTVEEEEQMLALKRDHYAWHCQACLGTYEPAQATPPGSYLHAAHFRRRVIEAHHVAHLQNDGSIGAKNLLVLCHFHHQSLGDQLTSGAVRAALAGAESVERGFASDAEGTQFIGCLGVLARVLLDVAPFEVALFFTPQHAGAWTS